MKIKKSILAILASAVLTAVSVSTSVSSITPSAPDDCHDDWLHVEGHKVCDMYGNQVLLTGCNWFGFNCSEEVFHGLWSSSLKDTVNQFGERGLNVIRVPISAECILNWKNGKKIVPSISTADNPELIGASSQEIFNKFLYYCKQYGVKAFIDIHSAESANSGHLIPLWYNGSYDTEDYYEALEYMATTYKDDDTLIGIDLKNEPHGQVTGTGTNFAKWDDSEDINNWKYVAETAANKVLAINPNMLILVEGVEVYPMEGYDYTAVGTIDDPKYYFDWWGGNLRGVKDYPLDLGENQDQLMYSPHDYGPCVFQQAWFDKDFTKESLYEDCWRDNWAYISENEIAPLLIGEWGGFLDGKQTQEWMTYLRDFMIEKEINHTFWCYNANSGDTGGFVAADFKTWDEKKYNFVKPALWQTEDGKFISLDHKKGMGSKGISVTDYYKIITVVKGDIDDNSIINSTDLALMRRYILNLTTLNSKAQKACDINDDGVINGTDFSLLKTMILNQE